MSDPVETLRTVKAILGRPTPTRVALAKAVDEALDVLRQALARERLPDHEPGPLFYIQDTRTYVGNSVMWWAPNGQGYTTHVARAGRYTQAEIVGLRESDVAWPCAQVDAIWSQHVDMQDLRKLPRQRNKKDIRS